MMLARTPYGYGTIRAAVLMTVLIGLVLVLLAVWFSTSSLPLMALLTGLLGAWTYAAAAGLNIAGFNGGIALGSLLGGASLEAMGLTSTAWVGAVAVGLGIVWMLWQMRGNRARRTEVPG